ncbi:MAG TPA: tetratricopeptide repeat protein [Pyrinomonadaceae bacterium]
MKKDSILVGIIGLLVGLIVGFIFANNINQRGQAGAVVAQQPNAQLPPDHPPITANGQQSGPDMVAVQDAINLAKSDQNNFAAQMKAADYSYQVQRFDDAIQFLTRANQLQPDSYDALVQLGNVNFDANRFPEAERWYTLALEKKPDDVNVRTDLGLTFLLREPANLERAITEFRASLAREPKHLQTLQNLTVALTRKGDTAEARSVLAKLEEVSPGNPAITNLRAELDKQVTAKANTAR